MNDFFKNSVKYLVASSLILSAGEAVGVTQIFAAENDGSKVIEDGGGQGGVTWEESYRKTSGSYTIIVYRSANGGNQWKEVTYDQYGNIVKVVYGTY
ncbi:hypothetical protein [Rossellomorea aquimaris]|uniref:hypothetical protein n=1 Tax=Rossellomorea aquimaris TaxID=189382 RepID=UPI0007D08FD1|nr:hypothetical protein [Rossellomorea aquimaris]